MILLKKEIDPDHCPILYDKPFTENSFKDDFTVCGGKWRVEEGWLIGENRGNFPGMAISKNSYNENVILDFEAATVLPCSHDINVMWNGSWNFETNTRDIAYVVGLEGWWHGKVGFEKSPEYVLNAATPLFKFEAGRIYRIQCGSIDGHIFVAVDGKLVLEVTDPEPIDFKKHGLVGFEAYCAKLKFRNFKIRKAVWAETADEYIPEF